MNCIVCNEIDNYRVCNKCGARVDARKSLYNWFKAKKQFESGLIKRIKEDNEKRKRDRIPPFDIEEELKYRMDTSYYKNALDKLERQGHRDYGWSYQDKYSPLCGLSKEEQDEYWASFNREVERIKDNDLSAKIIYHYNEDTDEFYNFNYFDDMIEESEKIRKGTS